MGENTQGNGITGAASSLLLGQSNVFLFDSIAVGRGRVQGGSVLAFNSGLISPTALFRGTGGGTNRVSSWSIGDASTGKSATVHGTNDFSLGTVDAMVDSLSVDVGAQATASTVGSGTLTYNAGKFDVNTLQPPPPSARRCPRFPALPLRTPC